MIAMRTFTEKLEKVFSAVAFAEQAEWDDAVKMAEGSMTVQAADGIQVQVSEKKQRRAVDHRPRLRV